VDANDDPSMAPNGASLHLSATLPWWEREPVTGIFVQRLAKVLLLSASWLACSPNSPEQTTAARQQLGLEVAHWTRLTLPAEATARAFHGAAYDTALNATIVFGGRHPDDRGSSLDDSGLLGITSWISLSSEYDRRGYVGGVFDSARGRIVTYGGMDVTLGPSYYAETWEFDARTGVWTLRSDSSPPGKRRGVGLAYDSRRNVTVLFGGYDGKWRDDIWEWDGLAWSKRCDTEPCSTAPRPAARTLPVFQYDAARGATLLFGGSGDDHLFSDTWSWDGERWLELTPNVSPTARDGAASTYDPVSRRVLMFGGLTGEGRDTSEFWAWDGSNWAIIAQTTSPAARRGASMLWDASSRSGILFGGSLAGEATDAWSFSLLGNDCSTSDDCHLGICSLGACTIEPPATGEGGMAGDSGAAGEATGGAVDGGGTSNQANAGGTTPAGTGGVSGAASMDPALGGNSGATSATAGEATAGEPGPSSTRPRDSFYSCTLLRPASQRDSAQAFLVLLALLVHRRRNVSRRESARRSSADVHARGGGRLCSASSQRGG
jgi:hypothetical protein